MNRERTSWHGRTAWQGVVVALLLAAACVVQAQLPTRQTMPQGVVLVVKVVDDAQLVPTTGIVVGRNDLDQPLVVIPHGFATEADEIIVLDGGPDVFANGKDAEFAETLPEEGLSLLAVDGLRQRPVRVTFHQAEEPHELRLAAFPGADALAAGTPPYWIPLKFSGATDSTPPAFLPGSPTPNLTGPLIDLCGQVAGLVLAQGAPGVDSPETPRVVFYEALRRLAEAARFELDQDACTQVASADPAAVAESAAQAVPVGQAPSNPPAGASSNAVFQDGKLGTGALVFLGSALLSGVVFWIIVRQRARGQRKRRVRQAQDAETVTFSASGLPTRATKVEQEAPFVPGTKPPGSSGWLRIEGSHADGRPLRAVTAVNEGKFKVTIGRAGVELAADGPGISRQHAVIQGEDARMTITDLGSRNGTFVNGVRCQRDEIFILNDGDKLLLGAAPVTVRLSPARGPIA